MGLRGISEFLPAVHWALLAAAALASSLSAFDAGVLCVSELRLLRAPADSSRTAQDSVTPSLHLRPTSHDGHGWTSAGRPFDEFARFSARVAHEQRIDLVQLQSEPVATVPARLGQMRVKLRMRGEYAGTKAFLTSLLTNFPGLTLEHLTIRHDSAVGRGGEAAPTATWGDDESAIELIQYSAPIQVGR
jgi:hypothetical protein